MSIFDFDLTFFSKCFVEAHKKRVLVIKSAEHLDVKRGCLKEAEVYQINPCVSPIHDKELVKSLKTCEVVFLHDVLSRVENISEFLSFIINQTNDDCLFFIAMQKPLSGLLNKYWNLTSTSLSKVNYVTVDDLRVFLNNANLQVIRNSTQVVFPFKLFGLGKYVNGLVQYLPVINFFRLRSYFVVSTKKIRKYNSVSVIVPCRNEAANIPKIVDEIPNFCDEQEIIFVEGGSQDNSYALIKELATIRKDKAIRALKQTGRGKWDAVIEGAHAAKHEVIAIYDADMTVPGSDLPGFFNLLCNTPHQFINGTRLIYPLENKSMQYLNYFANSFFAYCFSRILQRPYSDTLCGTKVLSRKHFLEIIKRRHLFKTHDPFGDFDLIYGAFRLNLTHTEYAVHYRERKGGVTQISRFRHGFRLLQIVFILIWEVYFAQQ